jgi:hypothetical protein
MGSWSAGELALAAILRDFHEFVAGDAFSEQSLPRIPPRNCALLFDTVEQFGEKCGPLAADSPPLRQGLGVVFAIPCELHRRNRAFPHMGRGPRSSDVSKLVFGED